MKFDVIVVGAGITGAATAYFLKKRGVKNVLLLDRDEPASGGTGKSAAIMRQHYSNPLAANLTRESMNILSELSKNGFQTGFSRTGYYQLLPEAMLEGARTNIAMLTSIGIATELQNPTSSRISELIDPEGVAAVLYEPDGGYADPVQATEAFVAAFKAQGGQFRGKTPVDALVGDSKCVTGVKVHGETIEADFVVNASGPWAGKLGKSVGIDMPLRIVREQDTVWEAKLGRPVPEGPISNAVDAIYLRPLGNRRFVVGRGFPKEYYDVDPNNYDVNADEEFVSDVLERLEKRFPVFRGAARIDSYASLYDVTPDWYPFAGARTGVAGYADAWGGSGHGFKLAPAIGRRLADWIVDGETDEEFKQLSHDRIAQGHLFVQKFGGNRG
ncbi:NAD(P)/FAD-dependent oxidoreductase [Cupriavidus taiwanensis]|uniref:Putative FAD dependent oxidoreductase n=1 Tax=Cupriavidus taiwanensis TaxID=164546 RepID=A0A7Z7NRW5_9BURK|nr:FAD-binding oxidoreductase [Cupriavidus taiwanensis]SOZ19479.1 putative FAD dependent oxidoreductase [Cupriavidus taiwanensis]SOZ97277.1 putative FAD dependent oxidoreductase [Cupriavidus taiwanensis]SPC26167.1 putative FAD dependent oxidoreductase [Cupriavidus taiwanensis]SPD37700.1 putative FAD dependent oxidoreductase [Cupriavidus taiwanensis]